ncbi:MAG: flagellar biosynthetic protein FliR [Methyloligellaceae bacterium]
MSIDFGFLPQTAFVFFLIFARVGTMIMVIPGIGDRAVPIRIRLTFALGLTLILYPTLTGKLPTMPPEISMLLVHLIYEVIIGIALAFSVRLIIAGLHAAGEVIAVQTGLAFAQSVDPSQGIQGTLVSNFMSLLSVTLIFAADLHHILLQTIVDSYTLFPVGNLYPAEDFLQVAIRTLANAFRIGLQLAAPFIVFGLVFYLGVGILSRLIPQVQVFFVAMPANIFFGFILFMMLLSTLMLWYLDYFGESLRPYLK